VAGFDPAIHVFLDKKQDVDAGLARIGGHKAAARRARL
jgi:hypothetical protein